LISDVVNRFETKINLKVRGILSCVPVGDLLASYFFDNKERCQ